MAKHKKTLEQKRKTDIRRQLIPQVVEETTQVRATFSLPTYQFQQTKPNAAVLPKLSQTTTLAHGLEKTIVVSSIIIALQLAIFFLLTHHILILPSTMLRY